MADVLEASVAADWRRPDPARTLYLELPGGRVVIELAPDFAPRHVANILKLARGGYYDGLPNAASMSVTPAATHLGAWYWIGSPSRGQTLLALDPARYQIDFADAATILVQADCNRGPAAYSLDAGAFSVGPIGLTRMACPADSQDREFLPQLASGKSLNTAGNGLSIELAEGRGTMHFARDPKSSLQR